MIKLRLFCHKKTLKNGKVKIAITELFFFLTDLDVGAFQHLGMNLFPVKFRFQKDIKESKHCGLSLVLEFLQFEKNVACQFEKVVFNI